MQVSRQKALEAQASLQELLREDGYSVGNYDKQLYCPFHDDRNKKSASYYVDGDVIYCFKECKVYGVYDYLTKIRGISDSEIEERYEIKAFQRPEKVDWRRKSKDRLREIKLKFARRDKDIDETVKSLIETV